MAFKRSGVQSPSPPLRDGLSRSNEKPQANAWGFSLLRGLGRLFGLGEFRVDLVADLLRQVRRRPEPVLELLAPLLLLLLLHAGRVAHVASPFKSNVANRVKARVT